MRCCPDCNGRAVRAGIAEPGIRDTGLHRSKGDFSTLASPHMREQGISLLFLGVLGPAPIRTGEGGYRDQAQFAFVFGCRYRLDESYAFLELHTPSEVVTQRKSGVRQTEY